MLPDSHWLEKLNDEKHALIVEAIAKSVPYEFAAGYARICESTLYTWLRKGKEDLANSLDTKFSRLLQDIKAVEADRVMAHVKACEDQTERWQARMTLLERRWRSQFSIDGGEIVKIKDELEELKGMIKTLVNPPQVITKEDM